MLTIAIEEKAENLERIDNALVRAKAELSELEREIDYLAAERGQVGRQLRSDLLVDGRQIAVVVLDRDRALVVTHSHCAVAKRDRLGGGTVVYT